MLDIMQAGLALTVVCIFNGLLVAGSRQVGLRIGVASLCAAMVCLLDIFRRECTGMHLLITAVFALIGVLLIVFGLAGSRR
jgi:hypothetical protein